MWLEGGWMGLDYSVVYVIGDFLFGLFVWIGKVLQQDMVIVMGVGYYLVIILLEQDCYYMVYYCCLLGIDNFYYWEVCIDELKFDEQGLLFLVKMI